MHNMRICWGVGTYRVDWYSAWNFLTQFLLSITKVNSVDTLVTTSHPRYFWFNFWLLYFNEWSGTVANKEKQKEGPVWNTLRIKRFLCLYAVCMTIVLQRFNCWLLYFNEWGGTVTNKETQKRNPVWNTLRTRRFLGLYTICICFI